MAAGPVLDPGLSPHGRGKPLPFLQLRLCPARVYPRTGGGNRPNHFRVWGRFGSIPARAGETLRRQPNGFRFAVYPRTGGGNACTPSATGIRMGLSPHGRGKLPKATAALAETGSIPARAGETGRIRLTGFITGVYPRTGGGNTAALRDELLSKGLSPHGRGKPETVDCPKCGTGSIPARAGETAWSSLILRVNGVYPRTGGGN